MKQLEKIRTLNITTRKLNDKNQMPEKNIIEKIRSTLYRETEKTIQASSCKQEIFTRGSLKIIIKNEDKLWAEFYRHVKL